MSESIKDKLKQVEDDIHEMEFVIRYKGREIHSSLMPVPSYAEDVLANSQSTFDLFFYDMTKKLKEKIDKKHQDMFFDKQDKSGVLNEKISGQE